MQNFKKIHAVGLAAIHADKHTDITKLTLLSACEGTENDSPKFCRKHRKAKNSKIIRTTFAEWKWRHVVWDSSQMFTRRQAFCSRWWICRLDTDRRIRSCLAMQAGAQAEVCKEHDAAKKQDVSFFRETVFWTLRSRARQTDCSNWRTIPDIKPRYWLCKERIVK
jgi:hypothetical protein